MSKHCSECGAVMFCTLSDKFIRIWDCPECGYRKIKNKKRRRKVGPTEFKR